MVGTSRDYSSLRKTRYLNLRNLALFCVWEDAKSELIEIIPFMCTPAIWGRYPVHFSPSCLRVSHLGSCNVKAWWLQYPLFTEGCGRWQFSFPVPWTVRINYPCYTQDIIWVIGGNSCPHQPFGGRLLWSVEVVPLHCKPLLLILLGLQTSKVKLAPSCPTLCDPMDCSPSGSSVHGILQARMLERVATLVTHSSTLSWKIPWTEDLVGCCLWGR